MGRISYGIVLGGGILLISCWSVASDLIWMHKKTVAVKASDFEKCVTMAVNDVHGVSVNRALSNAVNIELNVELQKSIPFLSVAVQRRPNNFAEVIFAGRGIRESGDENAEITPLIESITGAIANKCTE